MTFPSRPFCRAARKPNTVKENAKPRGSGNSFAPNRPKINRFAPGAATTGAAIVPVAAILSTFATPARPKNFFLPSFSVFSVVPAFVRPNHKNRKKPEKAFYARFPHTKKETANPPVRGIGSSVVRGASSRTNVDTIRPKWKLLRVMPWVAANNPWASLQNQIT